MTAKWVAAVLRTALSVLLSLTACSHVTSVYPPYVPEATRDNKQAVPQGYFDLSKQPDEPACEREVPIVREGVLTGYEVISETTVTCSPGAVRRGHVYDCDEELHRRACALNADAIVVGERGDAASRTARFVRRK